MKIIAFYLPQFHEIPENNKWWGEGFTEWTNVKKAKPLFPNHEQPRIPLNNNYYNLLEDEVKKWQVNLAKQNKVDGFCFYHYWFNGKMLLEKPVEQFLANKELDIEFCISWANEPWTNAWVSSNDKLLMKQSYGGMKEWLDHFNYLLPFFKDKRYIKENNKPLFIIYRPDIMECYEEMINYWNNLAIENGFDGINFCYQHPAFQTYKNKKGFNYGIEYQPISEIYWENAKNKKLLSIATKLKIQNIMVKYLKLNFTRKKKLIKKDYDTVWQNILNHYPENESVKMIPGAFVGWDNTPRRAETGSVYIGANPQKFKNYFGKQYKRAIDIYKSNYIFIFAWNEWAEGGYLEPDTINKFGYLEAIKQVVEENNKQA